MNLFLVPVGQCNSTGKQKGFQFNLVKYSAHLPNFQSQIVCIHDFIRMFMRITLAHSLPSIMQTQLFIIISLIITFKILKMSLKCLLLLHVSASRDHHEATVNCMGLHVSIFICCYCMSYSRMYALTFLMLFSCCGIHAMFPCAWFS
jgi:hypothetical protein